jgi:hypothetical protein
VWQDFGDRSVGYPTQLRVYLDGPEDASDRLGHGVGRIYQTRTGPESLRWFWALHAPSKPGEMRTSNQVATLEVAKVAAPTANDALRPT